MTFLSEAQKPHSERFMLVKIRPRRLLPAAVFVSGSTYEYTDLDLDRIDVVVIAGVEHDTADWDYTDGTLTITSAPGDLTDENAFPVTVDHDLFLSGTKVRETSGVSGIPDAVWLPLITKYPGFEQSMRNIIEGMFTLSGTNVEIITTDRWVQQFLGVNDSFSKAPVDIWCCINDVTINRKIFSGEVSKVGIKDGRASFSLLDSFQRLLDTASFGSKDEAYVVIGSSITPYAELKDENKPVPIVFAGTSPFKQAEGYRSVYPFGSPAPPTAHLFDGLPLIKIGPLNPVVGDVMQYLAGRIIGTDLKFLLFGTISDAAIHYLNATVIDPSDAAGTTHLIYHPMYYFQCSNFNGSIGDYIPGYGWVAYVGSFMFGGTAYNLAVSREGEGPIGRAPLYYEYGVFPPPPTSGPITPPVIPDNTYLSYSIWFDRGNAYNVTRYADTSGILGVPYYIFDLGTRYVPAQNVVLTPQGTVGGETVYYVYFDVDSDNIGDVTSQLKCRFATDTGSINHERGMEFIVKSAGMDTNSTSFTQAGIDLATTYTFFTIPNFDALGNFKSYLEYAQDLARSTMSLLRLNEDREVEYEIISDPQLDTPDAERTRVDMLQGDTQTSVEYQDIVAQVDFENIHFNTTGAKTSVTDSRLSQLHQSEVIKTVKHVLQAATRAPDIANYYMSPTVEYNLSTASKDLASQLGDVIEVDNKSVADSGTVKNGLITEISASGNKTSIKINEIRGI